MRFLCGVFIFFAERYGAIGVIIRSFNSHWNGCCCRIFQIGEFRSGNNAYRISAAVDVAFISNRNRAGPNWNYFRKINVISTLRSQPTRARVSNKWINRQSNSLSLRYMFLFYKSIVKSISLFLNLLFNAKIVFIELCYSLSYIKSIFIQYMHDLAFKFVRLGKHNIINIMNIYLVV